MSERVVRVVALLAAALVAIACSPRPFRVVLIGDSITAGAVSAPAGPPYAQLLAEQLGPGFEIVNVACGGASVRDWLPLAPPTQCRAAGPDAIPLYAARARPALPADAATILLGSNDTLGGFEPAPVEPQAYQDALRELAATLHADGAREVVLLSPPAVLRRIVGLGTLRERVKGLCGSEPWLRCGPDLIEVLDTGTDFAPGNIHPNGPGHAKIAAALAATLHELAARPR